MSASLSPSPIFQGIGFGGLPVPSGKLFTYAAGTSTPQATYVDSTQTTQNSNPVILNANGQANVWLNPVLSYKFILQDALGNLIWSVDQINAPALTAAIIGAIIWPRSQLEINAGVVPSNFGFPWGDGRRYGSDPTGVSDSTSAINNALSSNGSVYLITGTYTISSSLTMLSGQTLYGDGSQSLIKYANSDLNAIVMSAVTSSIVRDIKLQCTGSTGVADTGGIVIKFNSTACKVERVEIQGVNWAGVWITGSSYCEVRNCYFHDFLGNQADTCDVFITDDGAGVNAANYNIVDSNQCFGGGYFGVGVMQFFGTTGLTPNFNTVVNNRIGQHTAYGILLYNVVANTDTYNSAIGNYIENIQGTVISNASGAGIYVNGSGGCVIANNTIKNCCVHTTLDTLAPAGIGIAQGAGSPIALAPVVVSGNFIQDPQNFYGIKVVGALGGVNISGNTIKLNSGTPADAIRITAAANVTIDGNFITVNTALASTRGIFINAAGASISNVSITGNNVLGTSLRGIAIDQSGGFNTTDFSISGNVVTGGGSSSVSMLISAGIGGVISSNRLLANTTFGLSVSASTACRFDNNYISTTGATSVNTIGACTSSSFDETNLFNGTLVNAATGLICSQITSAQPSTGTAAIGDHWRQSTPTASNPPGGYCITAGAPGTWKNEANLSA